MTTVNGTIKICDDTKLPSLILLCTGPNCAALGYNFTCTQQSSALNCSNGITCSGTSQWSSTFTMNQPNLTFTETQVITSNGSTYVLAQDQGGNVTITNQTSTSTSSPGTATTISSRPSSAASAVPQPTIRKATWLVILTLAMFVSSGAAQVCLSQLQIVGKISNDFLESLKSGSWDRLQEDMCAIAEGQALGQTPASESLEQQLMGVCVSALLVAELEFAVAAGNVISGEVTFPLTESLVGQWLGRGAAAAALGGRALAGLTALEGAAWAFLFLGVLDTLMCPFIVRCFLDSFFDNTAEAVCSSSAPAFPSASALPTTTAPPPSSVTTMPLGSSSTGTFSFGVPTLTGSLLPVPSINLGSTAAKCQLCLLNSYFATGVDKYCYNDTYVSTKSVLGYFCDPSVEEDLVFSQLCSFSCNNPCDQFDTNAWLAQLGSFAAGPYFDDYNCFQYCTDNPPKGNISCLGSYGYKGTWCVGMCPGADACNNRCIR